MILVPIVNEKYELEKTIELLRKEMIHIGLQDGFTSEGTVILSQKLDFYIAKYQTLKNR
jgi:hypothetical protein